MNIEYDLNDFSWQGLKPEIFSQHNYRDKIVFLHWPKIAFDAYVNQMDGLVCIWKIKKKH